MKFIITVDDAGLCQTPEAEDRGIAFFRKHDVPASFFVVPCQRDGRVLADEPHWVRRARTFEAEGHDYQLHGCTHAGFEFGPPESWMVQICGDQAIRAEAAGWPEHQPDWTPDVLRAKFVRGMTEFERAFDRRPQVFRAGCLAAQKTAFDVMAEIGLLYDSDKIVDPRTWDYVVRKFDSPRPWDPLVPPHPYRLNARVVELPCAGEYAWTLSEETLHHFIDLAADDMRRVHDAGGVFILMCHQQRVGGDDPLPRKVLDEIFRAAKRDFAAEFMTLAALVGQIERGQQPVSPTPEQE